MSTIVRTTAPHYGRTPRELLRDPKITARAKALYGLLDDYADSEGRAFPSRRLLGESLGCSTDSIDRAVAELEAAGWLARTVRRRPDRTFAATVYSLEWSPGGSRTGAAMQPHGCGGGSRTGAEGVAAPVPTEEEPQEEEPQEALMLTADAASERAPASGLSKPERDGLFEQFWSTYPRKTGKGTARSKFDRLARRDAALARAAIDGARRLATDPNLPEPQFIPHPTTWLNREGWHDEPLPPRAPAAGFTPYVDAPAAHPAGGDYFGEDDRS